MFEFVYKKITTKKPTAYDVMAHLSKHSNTIVTSGIEPSIFSNPYERRKQPHPSYNDHRWEKGVLNQSQKIEYLNYLEMFGEEICNNLLGQDLCHITVFSLSDLMIPYHFRDRMINSIQHNKLIREENKIVYVCFGPPEEESNILADYGEIPFIPFMRFDVHRTEALVKSQSIDSIASAFIFSGKEITFNKSYNGGDSLKSVFNPNKVNFYHIEDYCNMEDGSLSNTIKSGTKRLLNIAVFDELKIRKEQEELFIKYEIQEREYKNRKSMEETGKPYIENPCGEIFFKK